LGRCITKTKYEKEESKNFSDMLITALQIWCLLAEV
jgi:hypothetical protein